MTATVTTLFRAVTGGFTRNVGKATTTLNKYGKAAEVTGGKTQALNNSLRNATRGAAGLGGALGSINLGRFAGIGGVSAAIVGLGAAAISAASAFENLQVRFNTFTQSAGQTDLLFERISNTAQRTGTQITTLRETQSRLQFLVAQGVTTQTRLNDILDSYANLAALSGTSTLDLALSMRGFAQAAASPIVQMQEIRQIAEAIPSLFAGFAKALNLSEESLRDFVASGRLTQTLFLRVFPQALRSAANNAEATADRISASWTNVSNTTTLVLEDLGIRYREAIIGFNRTTANVIQGLGDLATKGLNIIENVKNRYNAIELNKETLDTFREFAREEGIIAAAIDQPATASKFFFQELGKDIAILGRIIGKFLDESGATKLVRELSVDPNALANSRKAITDYVDAISKVEQELRKLSSVGTADALLVDLSGAETENQLKNLLDQANKRRDIRKETIADIERLEKRRVNLEKELGLLVAQEAQKATRLKARADLNGIRERLSNFNQEKNELEALERKLQNNLINIKSQRFRNELSIQGQIDQLRREELDGFLKTFITEKAIVETIAQVRSNILKIEQAQSGEERKVYEERTKALIEQAKGIISELGDRDRQIRKLEDLKKVSGEFFDAQEKSVNNEKAKVADRLTAVNNIIGKLEEGEKKAENFIKSIAKIDDKNVKFEIQSNIDEVQKQILELIRLKNLLNENPRLAVPPAQPSAGFATGGYIPGIGRGDRQLIAAEAREFVIRRSAAQSLGPNVLNALNRYGMRGLQQLITKGIGGKGSISIPTLPAGVMQKKQDGGFVSQQRQAETVVVRVEMPNGASGIIPTTRDGQRDLVNLLNEAVNLA